MANQIIRQPDGRFAVFCRNTNTITVYDASETEVVEFFAEAAAEAAREDVRRKLKHVAAGEPGRVYFQHTLTWDEALASDREHGGEVSERFSGD